MKYTLIAIIFLVLASCSVKKDDNSKNMQAEIDSLKKELANTYKPGLGEFMTDIQLHHSNLWFAGINENWELADIEFGEIRETLEAIQKHNTDRPEIKSLTMLSAPLDSINQSIGKKNPSMFKASFTSLTQACNSCHQANKFGFNVITIPMMSPVTNQDFRKLSK